MSPLFQGKTVMKFPRLVYKSADKFKLAADNEAFDSLVKAGWFATVPEAIAAKTAPDLGPVDEVSPPTRAGLEQRATELGIKFDGRNSDKKLADLIASRT